MTKGVGVPKKVPVCDVVLLYVMAPLPAGVPVPLAVAAVEEVVELTWPYPPTWAHRLEAYALVALIGLLQQLYCR